MLYLGVDPGANGAAVLITEAQQVASVLKFKDATEADIAEWFREQAWERHADGMVFARIERVHSSPQMGVRSAFTFGQSFGFLRGMLVAHGIPFEAVTPGKWQRALGCLSKGQKNVTKAKAQELFPQHRWTHATADAVLLAEFCRRSQYQGGSDG